MRRRLGDFWTWLVETREQLSYRISDFWCEHWVFLLLLAPIFLLAAQVRVAPDNTLAWIGLLLVLVGLVLFEWIKQLIEDED